MDKNLETLEYKIDEPVAIIDLNRPGKLNSLSRQMSEEMQYLLNIMKYDERVKAIVLEGRGQSFCAGADLEERIKADPEPEAKYKFYSGTKELVRAFINVDKPVIALLHGWVIGGGALLALHCDLRVAAEDTKFWIPELRFGSLILGGVIKVLPRIVGVGRAKQILFEAEPIDAVRAKEWGLYNEVVPINKLQETGIEMAKKISIIPHLTLKLTRELMELGTELSLDGFLKNEPSAATVSTSRKEHADDLKKHFQKARKEK